MVMIQSHKSHNTPVSCPTMHHFVTEICTCVHISLTEWCIVWYFGWCIAGFVRWVPIFFVCVITFLRYWPFVRGILRSPVNSPHKSQWRGALMFSLICVWTKGWANNRDAGDLRRHPAHYDVVVIVWGNAERFCSAKASEARSYIHTPVNLPWLFPGAPLNLNGASGNSQGKLRSMYPLHVTNVCARPQTSLYINKAYFIYARWLGC